MQYNEDIQLDRLSTIGRSLSSRDTHESPAHPDEGVCLIQAFVSIRDHNVRAEIVRIVSELAVRPVTADLTGYQSRASASL
jgi:hypothetical protein